MTIAAGGAATLFFVYQFFAGTIVPRDEVLGGILGSLALSALVGGYLLEVGRRLKAAPASLAGVDGAVLYLRAFDEERRPFAVGPKAVLARYTTQFGATAGGRTRRQKTLRLTLEDFLEEAITAQIGPFVGLGNPGDRLPPDGATREYAPDATWRDRFMELARRAKCIVIALGESDNLQWELQQLREGGLSRKLCLFTPPRVPASEIGDLARSLESEASRRSALAAAWSASAAALRRAGYDCDPECPGDGAAVAFDEHGRSVLLTTEAALPADYVTPVADWFNTGTKSGRCVPASCSACGARIYEAGGAAASPRLCYACQGAQQLKEMSGVDRTFERHPVLMWIWIFSSMVITATLMALWSLSSVWVYVPLWALVIATPWLTMAAWRWVRARAVAGRRGGG